MEASYRLSYEEFLNQFSYVNRVVSGCKTEAQLENAKNWASDWSQRMKRMVPGLVQSAEDLYLSVIEK